MNERSRRRKKRRVGPGIILIPFFLAAMVGIGILIWFVAGRSGNKEESVDQQRLSEGVDYLLSMESKDVSEVESEVKMSHGAAAKIDMEAEDFNVWSCFGDIVLMGDSRTKEFSHSELIEERRVLAEDGTSILSIADRLGELKELNPSYVIVQFGINDMEDVEVWANAEEYATDLIAKIGHIQEAVPNAVIFMQAIFPCVEPELSRLECRQEIPYWNEVIQEHCEEAGIPFIDLNYLTEEYPDYYEPDGMHFKYAFYEHWAKGIIAEVQKYEGY